MILMKIRFLSSFNLSLSISLFTFLTMLNSNWAQAQEFDVNLRSKLGFVRDQGKTGICFAHAAADALSLVLNERVGALSVMVQYFANRGGFEDVLMTPLTNGIPKTFQAGLASRALKVAAESVLCRAEMEEIDTYYSRKDFASLIGKYQKYRSTFSPTRPVAIIQEVVDAIQALFPAMDRHVIEDRLSPFKSLPKFLSELIDEHCELSASDVRLEVVGDELELQSKDRILEVINEALDHEAIAVIHYNPKFLVNMDSYFWENQIGFHVSSIVGRRKADNRVFYLLRNTWGESCRYAEPYRSRCHQGHIWISEADVRAHVTSAAYLRVL